MKKEIIGRFAGIFIASAINSLCYSQNAVAIVKIKHEPRFEHNDPATNDHLTPGSTLLHGIPTIDVNKKVLKKFTRDQKNHPDARWFRSSTGLFVAFFTKDAIQTFVYYNEKGAFEFMIRYYKEKNLPRDVRHQVRTCCNDFTIYHVTEITRNDKIAYAIKLEDKTSWKTIKFIDNQMEVMEEYSKR